MVWQHTNDELLQSGMLLEAHCRMHTTNGCSTVAGNTHPHFIMNDLGMSFLAMASLRAPSAQPLGWRQCCASYPRLMRQELQTSTSNWFEAGLPNLFVLFSLKPPLLTWRSVARILRSRA